MPSLLHHRHHRPTHPIAQLVAGLASLAVPLGACDDGPGAPLGPGNTIVNDTMQDAVATYTQDATVGDVYAPQGNADAAYAYDGSPSDASYVSTGYEDVSSPAAACATCTCGKTVGFCLENGTAKTVTGLPEAGRCAMATMEAPEVGCNPLPADCATHPTCACILNAVQPPLGCYPECTSAAGYFDVFCNTP